MRGLRWLGHNWGTKVLSLVFAVILWSYVLSITNLPRSRTLENIPVYTSGISTLESNALMLSKSMSQKVRVTVEVLRPQYQLIRTESIKAQVNLSNIKTPGKHRVALEVSSQFGQVMNFSPNSVEVEIEPLLHRTIPIVCVSTGHLTQDVYLKQQVYSPQQVTITGPVTLVKSINRAIFRMQLNSDIGDFQAALPILLQDQQQRIVSDPTIHVNQTNVIYKRSVFPTRSYSIDVMNSMVGFSSLSQDFEIRDIKILPQTVKIAWPTKDIPEIQSIQTDLFTISKSLGDHQVKVKLNLPSGIIYSDYKEVSIAYTIAEKRSTQTFDNLRVKVKKDGTNQKLASVMASVTITGPKRAVDFLRAGQISLFANADGLASGLYMLPLEASFINADKMDEILITPEKVQVSIK